MNFFRKSSMILAGAAAAGLLAFACAGGDAAVSGSSSEVIASSTKDLLIAKVYAGGSQNAGALAGDYIEIFNPTDHAISRKLLALQLADKTGAFSKDYKIDLADPKDDKASIASGHYFLVSLKPGADLGVTPDLEAAPIVLEDGGAPVAFGLDVAGGSIALVNAEDLLDCDQPQNCTNAPNVKSVFGYGKIACTAPLAETKAFAALGTTTAAVRKAGGCYANGGSNAADFEIAADLKPFDPAVGLDCSTVAQPDAGAQDAGAEDAGAQDAGAEDAAAASRLAAAADDSCTPDGGPKPTTKDGGKQDAGDDDSDDSEDETPAPVTGKKKKTNANAAPQPIAASESSCAAAPGPVPTSSVAGLAGLGLAVASFVRRKKK